MRKKSYPLVDLYRLPAAFLVIAIHVSPLAFINETADFILTRVIARTAVPFFIMITGYFVLPKISGSTIAKEIKKCAIFYMAAILLYLPVNVYARQLPLWTNEGTLDPWWMLRLIRWIFVDGTFYHLWYFPAMITGLLLVALLLSRFSPKTVLMITMILYAIGLMGDSYYGLAAAVPGLEAFYNGIFALCTYTRNGVFFVPLFLMLGRTLAIRHSSKPISKPAKRTLPQSRFHYRLQPETCFHYGILLTAAAFILMLTEALMLRHFHIQRHDSMYIFLPVLMYAGAGCLFRACRRSKIKRNLAPLRKIALIIYVIHPMVIIGLRGADKLLGLNGALNHNVLLVYIFTCILSLLFALLAVIIDQRLKARRKKTDTAHPKYPR